MGWELGLHLRGTTGMGTVGTRAMPCCDAYGGDGIGGIAAPSSSAHNPIPALCSQPHLPHPRNPHPRNPHAHHFPPSPSLAQAVITARSVLIAPFQLIKHGSDPNYDLLSCTVPYF